MFEYAHPRSGQDGSGTEPHESLDCNSVNFNILRRPSAGMEHEQILVMWGWREVKMWSGAVL